GKSQFRRIQAGYDRNYHQILPIIAEKVHRENVQQEKLKAVKARLNFEEASHHSESGTPIRRRGLKERLGPRYVRSRSGSPEPRRGRSESPKKKGPERKAMFKRLEKCVFHRLGDKGKNVSVHSDDSRRWSHHSSRIDTESCYQSSRSRATESAFERRYNKRASSRRTEELSESEGSAGGHWKSKLKRQKSSIEDDLSQPWVCEETDPFTPRIRYFGFPKTRMPIHIKTYDGSEDPEDHLKIFQSAAKTERWAMPTWCHMFNSTLTENARQKKCIKDPVEIHNIRQRDGESTKEFVRRYKLECRDVKGALECMKISGFMHGIINPELIKRLHDKIPKSVDEMLALGEDEGTEGPMIIEVEIGGHCIHTVLARSPSPIQWIIGRPGVRKLQAVPSIAHGMLKIPVEGGVITLKSSKLVPLECAVVSGPEGNPSATKPTIEERVKVAINLEYPEQTVMIGSTLTEEGCNKLCNLLQ
ncbi:hypothetical protein Tco_0459742, partial [Tanacetum coccineum]